jgi:uncharacterized caspase-like protein
MFPLLTLFLLILVAPTAVLAEARVALLIGNQQYGPEFGLLSNPHNDVSLLEKTMKSLGFEVVTVKDAGLAALYLAVNGHVRKVRAAGPGALSFVYYSGHGAQDATTGVNYLIPVDVRSTEDGELWDQSLRLTDVTGKLKAEAGDATHFVVFDACRNGLKLKKVGTRAILQSKGFVPVRDVSGMLIAYATAEGELASDAGAGAGPYSLALAEEIVKPGVEAVTMFRRVQVRVRAGIGQEPWLGFNGLGEVHFAGREIPTLTSGSSAASPNIEPSQAWEIVKETNDIRTLEAFRKQFGKANGFLDRLAETRIEELKRQQAPARQNAKDVPPKSTPPKPVQRARNDERSPRQQDAPRKSGQGMPVTGVQ